MLYQLPAGKSRLNLVIDTDLKDWAVRYARSHGLKLTRLIVDHFISLRDKEAGLNVEQI